MTTAPCAGKEPTCRAEDPCMQPGSGISNRLNAHLERRQALGLPSMTATQQAGLMAVVRDVIGRYALALAKLGDA